MILSEYSALVIHVVKTRLEIIVPNNYHDIYPQVMTFTLVTMNFHKYIQFIYIHGFLFLFYYV